MQSILGLMVFVAIAWRVSQNRKHFPWKLVATGLLLQFLIALLLLKLPTTEP